MACFSSGDEKYCAGLQFLKTSKESEVDVISICTIDKFLDQVAQWRGKEEASDAMKY